jgi:hypothetical protein
MLCALFKRTRETGNKNQDVYENAVCNIAAESSAGAHDGLLAMQKARTFPVVPCRLLDTRDEECFINIGFPSWSQSVSCATLQSRGWVLQERHLSLRVLHFTQHGLFWECAEMKASDLEPHRLDQPQAAWVGKDSIFVRDDLKSLAETQLTTTFWFKLVELFSEKELTKPEDTLPAISGIVKRLQERTSATYLAGLWGTNLVEGLAWYARPRPSTGVVPSSKMSGPSWTWASVSAKIYYFNRSYGKWSYVCKFVKGEIRPAGLNALGAVSFGRVRLSGPFFSYQVDVSERGGSGNGLVLEFRRHDIYMDTLPCPEVDGIIWNVFCLEVCRRDKFDHETDRVYYVRHGLLLLRPSPSLAGAYVRIGWMEIYDLSVLEEIGERTIDII